MKHLLLTVVIAVLPYSAWASENMEHSQKHMDHAKQKVTFKNPQNGATVKNPVHVCIDAEGVEVLPAAKGIHPGKGHHHILVDVELPKELGKPIPKDEQHIHMGDGSHCKNLTLSPGKHTLRLLFANGAHVPMSTVESDTVEITVEE